MNPVDLRQERQRRGLSLDDVSRRSRIPRRYLDALETGRTEGLPRGPFFDSYQRQYLAFLGLPPQATISVRPRPIAPRKVGVDAHLARDTDTARAPDADARSARDVDAAALPDEPTLEHEATERSRTITRQYDSVPVIRLVLAGFLVTLALVLTMKLLSGLVDRAAESAATPAVVSADPPTAAELAAADDQTPPPDVDLDAPEPAAGVALAAPPVPQMRVHLRAHERVHVRVELDGEPALSEWLEPGDEHDFLGADEIAVDVSDLTRLAIAYDGQRVEPLGNLSHPRRLVFLRDE